MCPWRLSRRVLSRRAGGGRAAVMLRSLLGSDVSAVESHVRVALVRADCIGWLFFLLFVVGGIVFSRSGAGGEEWWGRRGRVSVCIVVRRKLFYSTAQSKEGKKREIDGEMEWDCPE